MKNKKSIFIIAPLLVGIVVIGCSVKAPEVSITGDKTALENQVIGTYQQIEEDVWTLASVRSASPGQQPKMSADKQKVLEAVRGRKFNKDDIDEFLAMGVVGENNRGFLEIHTPEKLDADPELEKRVVTIVENENSYRQIIMNRIMVVNERAADAGEENVSRIFAKLNQDNVAPGSWIQTEQGEWIQKPAVQK
ncbi:MAG TPA: DUF1318 domain-containing protein [bacterium]|nr:DUF1318 domain-containing protein [bacterium]